MIRIEIHSSIVHLADIVWFPGNICSLCTVNNTEEAHSHLKSTAVSVKSIVALISAVHVFESLVQNALI